MSANFNQQTVNGIHIISCPKRLDAQNSDELKDLLSKSIDKQSYRIILDFSKTVYIDSSGLGAIVSVISIARANLGDIRLAVVSKNIEDLLEITHLNKVLRSFKSVEDSLNSFV